VAGPDALLASTLGTGTPGAAVTFVPSQELALDLAATKLLQVSTPTLRPTDGTGQVALATGPRPTENLATPGTLPPASSSVAPTPAAKQVEGSLRWMLRTGAQEAQLQLHPDSLGQVTIHLKVEGGEVHARIWVTDPSSAQAVQEGRAHLEQSLKEQGLQLGSFDLQQGNHPSREAPAAPSHTTSSAAESLLARQEAPAAPVASILNAHHVELYA
jgi:flagellar hook-length control protein FliK